jgi:hypothetical protein
MVIPSRTIHTLDVPHEPRPESPAMPSAHSEGEDTEDDTLSQKSDVAIMSSADQSNQNACKTAGKFSQGEKYKLAN